MDVLPRALTICLAALATLSFAQNAPTGVRIEKKDNGFALVRNGQPYFIKGASGSVQYIDALKAAGGNSLRFPRAPSESNLDVAQKDGISVMIGLDPADPDQAVQTVRRLKANPAILVWALGNAPERNASTEQRIRIWQSIEQLARAVKAEDPSHPVIAVLDGTGDTKLRELDQHCPSLDAVGLNEYGDLASLPAAIQKQGFTRPYIVTEFGARAETELVKTTWGMPIEDTSSETEDLIIDGYSQAVANHPQCLGAYVYLWGAEEQNTRSWYALFLPDGKKLGGVDAMQLLWTGKWPPYRCPVIDGSILEKATNPDDEKMPSLYRPGAHVNCSIFASDPLGEPITVEWEVRPEGNGPATPIAGAVGKAQDKSAEIVMPATPGDYRIFVHVYNQHGGAATANLPVEVK